MWMGCCILRGGGGGGGGGVCPYVVLLFHMLCFGSVSPLLPAFFSLPSPTPPPPPPPPPTSPHPQCFGDCDNEHELNDIDLLSAVEFDADGGFLATGDKGGRVVLFECSDRAARSAVRAPKRGDTSGGGGFGKGAGAGAGAGAGGGAGAVAAAHDEDDVMLMDERAPRQVVMPDYHFFAEFQSHSPEFDYLKSVEIEEKINKVRKNTRQSRKQASNDNVTISRGLGLPSAKSAWSQANAVGWRGVKRSSDPAIKQLRWRGYGSLFAQ